MVTAYNAQPTPSFVSLAMLCVTLQTSPGRVRQLLAELGATPAVELNGVPHYAGELVDRLAARIHGRSESGPIAGVNVPLM